MSVCYRNPKRKKPKKEKNGAVLTHDRFNREVPPRLAYVFGQFDEGVRTIRQHLITDHTYWERIDEEIKNTHGHVSKNKNYWSIRDALGALSKTVYMLGKNAPHCVCPNCSGIDNECITCDGAGWLGERV